MTLTQSLVYLALAVLGGPPDGASQTTTNPAVLVASEGRV